MKRLTKELLITISLICLVFVLAGCGSTESKNATYEQTYFLMDTDITFKIEAASGVLQEDLDKICQSAYEAMNTAAKYLDRFGDENYSDPVRIAQNAGSDVWTEIQPLTYEIITRMMEMEYRDDTKVNLAVGPLTDIWTNVRDTKALPVDLDITRAVGLVNMDEVFVEAMEGSYLAWLPESGMSIDFGSVAKGYIASLGANIIINSNVDCHGIIDAGGLIATIGNKVDGSAWKVGIADPDEPTEVIYTLYLRDNEVASTSGDYQRYVDIDGVRYHHIISPVDGYPVSVNKAATVVSKDGFLADYYSTWMFMTPWEDAIDAANSIDDIEVLIIDAQGQIHKSKGLN